LSADGITGGNNGSTAILIRSSAILGIRSLMKSLGTPMYGFVFALREKLKKNRTKLEIQILKKEEEKYPKRANYIASKGVPRSAKLWDLHR